LVPASPGAAIGCGTHRSPSRMLRLGKSTRMEHRIFAESVAKPTDTPHRERVIIFRRTHWPILRGGGADGGGALVLQPDQQKRADPNRRCLNGRCLRRRVTIGEIGRHTGFSASPRLLGPHRGAATLVASSPGADPNDQMPVSVITKINGTALAVLKVGYLGPAYRGNDR
jgi:hypothetical protein